MQEVWGAEIPHAAQHSQKIKINKITIRIIKYFLKKMKMELWERAVVEEKEKKPVGET